MSSSSQNKKELARELMNLMAADSAWYNTIESTLDAYRQIAKYEKDSYFAHIDKDMYESVFRQNKKLIEKVYAQMRKDILPFYEKNFTAEELKDYIRFYQSP